MAPRISSTRWVTGILVAALLASVLVVVGLIQITGQSPAAAPSPSPSSAGESGSGSAVASSAAVSSSDTPTTSAGASASAGRSAAGTPTTTPVELAGSGLVLPAAWTGTADMTITVHGRCAATGGTSLYTRPAQFALQVAPPVSTSSSAPSASGTASIGESVEASPGPTETASVDPTAPPSAGSASSSGSASAAVPAGPVSMSLGITPSDVPGLSIYSTTSGRDGSVRWTWVVQTRADPSTPDHTLVSATLLDDQPSDGALPPNLLVDSETDLQPCETGSGVRLPRPLAKGATVTGWVSATDASLQVTASTTDGERSVQADLTLTRTPGS